MLLKQSISLLLGLAFQIGICPAQSKSILVKPEIRCPDEMLTTAYYRNYSYGFSALIPRGLKGHWNSAGCVRDEKECTCMGDHGRFMPIDKDSYLEIFVGTQNGANIKESIDEEIEVKLKRHEAKRERVEVLFRKTTRLGGVRATRLKLRYRDAKTAKIVLEDSVLCPAVERYHAPFVYSVSLTTPQELYGRRKELFYSIIKSWKFRSLK